MKMFYRRYRAGLTAAALGFLVVSSASGVANGNSTVVGTVQVPPLKELSDKIMGLARAVQPGQQTEMLPMLFLSAFGYPEFPGVSRSDDVSIFLFEGDEANLMPFVVLAKVEPASQFRQMLPGFEMAVLEHGDWILISNDPANLKHVGDVDELIALNQRPRPFDLSVRSTLDAASLDNMAANLKQSLRERHLEAAGGETEEIELISKTRFVDFGVEILKNLKELDAGLNVSADGLGFGMAAEAHPGTPEAALLSVGPAGPVVVAEYLSAEYPVIYVASMDNAPLAAYTRSLVERGKQYVGENGARYLDDLQRSSLAWFNHSDGTVAGAMRFLDDEPDVASISGGNITQAAFDQLMSDFYEDLMPRFFELVPYFENRGVKPHLAYDAAAGETDGVQVQKVTVKMPLDMAAGIPGKDAVGLPDSYNESETYMAVVKGNVLSANSREDLDTLIKSVRSGTAAAPSVASQITLEPGEIGRMNVDLKPLAAQGLAAMGAMMAPALVDKIKAQLEEVRLAPLTGTASTAGGTFKVSAHLPASTMATLSKLYQEMQMEMQMQQEQQ